MTAHANIGYTLIRGGSGCAFSCMVDMRSPKEDVSTILKDFNDNLLWGAAGNVGRTMPLAVVRVGASTVLLRECQ